VRTVVVAARCVIETREADTSSPEAVECGGCDLAAVAAEVGIAHVVCDDENNVGA